MGNSAKGINNKFAIAGKKTNEDWHQASAKLVVGKEPDRWRQIFEEYFVERLRTRYLEPIRVISEINLRIGEGFSIVAIQCSLIEFLQTTIEGTNFNINAKENNTDYEYGLSKSKMKFVTFLTSQEPFSSYFDRILAIDFYKNVRCPVLHEARTTGWLIKEKDPLGQGHIIDAGNRFVYRNDLTSALWQYIGSYGKQLQNDPTYQAAFIRKFNALAKS
jgi:hypothetical protein